MRNQAHMFVDNSNLIGGAQRVALEREGVPWPAVRIYWRNFFELIESDYLPVTRCLAGSLPPGNDELWDYSRRYGYDTTLLKRVENDDGRLAEQAVDEVMHAKIAGVLLDYDPPQTLVLVTGDGNASEFGTSFLQQVQRALKRGWTVNVISWRGQLSNKFRLLATAHKEQVSIVELEDYFASITFLVEGDFHHNNGTQVHVQRRVVSALPKGNKG